MNLADYLSELLSQHEEVSVPGLGYFVREHVSAYYSESEARFYPPFHKVKFVPELRDNDLFAQYVADKKNISLASSKYFAEKFVAKLREDASKSKYLFSDLGSFRIEQEQLVFRPNEKIATDPSYYGYPPISIHKQGQPVFGEPEKPLYTPPIIPTVTTPQPVHTVLKQQYFEEDVERKRGVNAWMVVLIIIAVIALAIFGVYKFLPAVFDKVVNEYRQLTGSQQPVAEPGKHPTTNGAPKINTDYVEPTKTIDEPDSAKQSSWIIIESEYRTKHEAEAAQRYLKKMGVPSEVRTDLLGPLVKVTVGTYPTSAKADSAMAVLVNAGKISKKSHVDPLTQQ